MEADIVIVPLFPDEPGVILNEPFLLNSENILGKIAPEVKSFEHVVQVIHVPSVCQGQLLQIYLDGSAQEGIGFFGPRQLIAEEHPARPFP